jgi:hypothetical protein
MERLSIIPIRSREFETDYRRFDNNNYYLVGKYMEQINMRYQI